MKKAVIFLLCTFFAGSLVAHEYVLLPYNFLVKKGETLELHLFVSDGFNIQLELPVQKSITKNFKLISENGTRDLLPTTKDGDLPILMLEIDFDGLGLIHMERDYARITLPNDEFKSYLQLDNIENIKINDSTKTEQRERYTRYLKMLIQSEPKANDESYKTVVGQNFEIVLLQNPYDWNWASGLVLRFFSWENRYRIR